VFLIEVFDSHYRGPVLALGEIHTGLLQTSAPLSSAAAREVMALIPHRAVRTWERPIRHAVSPEVLVGIDDSLPAASGSRPRAVGTLATQVTVTGGRVVQGCARAQLVPSDHRRRMQWSYYLAHPARLETLGRLDVDDVAEGFLGREDPGFDAHAVACSGILQRVQGHAVFDRRRPMPLRRSRFRWAATALPAGANGFADLYVRDGLRTLRTAVPAPLMSAVPELCRDLALHDWLVTTAIDAVDRAKVGPRNRHGVVVRLGPLIDHVLPLWMPAARLADDLLPYWDAVDQRAGLTRQWQTLVQHVRDQVALAAVAGPPATRLPRSTAAPPQEHPTADPG